MIGNVIESGSTFPAKPSAIVGSSGITTRQPASSAYSIVGDAEGSTPYTLMWGLSDLRAIKTPAINPPPPTGTTIASRSGAAATISSPIVPWPAITSASLYGDTNVI